MKSTCQKNKSLFNLLIKNCQEIKRAECRGITGVVGTSTLVRGLSNFLYLLSLSSEVVSLFVVSLTHTHYT